MYTKPKLHLYITIFACVVMTAVNIYLQADLVDVAVRLIITILVFYIIGQLAEFYIRTKIFPPPVKEPDMSVASDDMDKAPRIHEPAELDGLRSPHMRGTGVRIGDDETDYEGADDIEGMDDFD